METYESLKKSAVNSVLHDRRFIEALKGRLWELALKIDPDTDNIEVYDKDMYIEVQIQSQGVVSDSVICTDWTFEDYQVFSADDKDVESLGTITNENLIGYVLGIPVENNEKTTMEIDTILCAMIIEGVQYAKDSGAFEDASIEEVDNDDEGSAILGTVGDEM